ncbi:MAG: flagellar hook-length control protein FliK [Candidatus Sericytochromatia bacterium]|nr:flagellar hook-length control protein FliK [Candidatus Sericytochromatia bacterium]
MFIRGIDFSRHSVVVGSQAEQPTPTTTNPNTLQNNQVVEARVIAAAGGEATLDIAGERVVAEAHTALNVGDKLFVRVEMLKDGMIRLAIQASAPQDGHTPKLPEAAIDTFLREAGLPVDDRSRLVARILIARDGSLDRASALRLLAALRPFEQAGPRETAAAALLQRAGVALTPPTIALLAAREMPEAPPRLGAILRDLLPAVAARAAAPRAPEAEAARALLVLLRGSAPSAPVSEFRKNFEAWIKALVPQVYPFRAGDGGKAEPARPEVRPAAAGAAATASDAVAEPSVSEVERPPAAPVRVPASQSGAPVPTHTETRAGGPAPRVPDLASLLEGLARALGPEHKGLKQRLNEAVAEVRYIQLMHTAAPTPSQPEQPLALPLWLPQLGGQQGESELQVHARAQENARPEPSDVSRLVFVLDTEHLGTVQADLALSDGVLNLSLGLADQADRLFVEQQLEEFKAAIARLGLSPGRVGTRLARSLPPGSPRVAGLGDVLQFDRKV